MLERQPEFAGIKVLGLGDNVVDRYVDRSIMYPGGNALNFAVYARLLGADASFTGTMGTDAGARHIRAVLAELQVPTPHLRVVEGEGGHADVMHRDGNREFLGSNKGGVANTHPPLLDTATLRTVAEQRLVHTSCFSHIDNRLAELRSAAPLLSYDFSARWTDSARLASVAASVDLLVLSLGESGRDGATALAAALERHGCSLAIMSMGAAGALLWSAGNAFVHVPAAPATIVDTLGAGDAFATAVVLQLLALAWRRAAVPSPEALHRAGSFAARVAAEVCTLDGAFGFGAPYTSII